MFSGLGPLFKIHPRQAEASDARLEIRRDEKQEQGKKQDFEDGSENPDLWQNDSASVSVEALRTFLIEFLKGRGETVHETSPYGRETYPVSERSSMQTQPPTPRAAAAVKAYTALSDHHPPTQHREATAEDISPVVPEDVDLASLLKADEIRTIHVLIRELDQLARQGVQTLMIEKADTFLESLAQAVRLEKTKF